MIKQIYDSYGLKEKKMPLPALKSLAKKAGKSTKDAERYWREASSCEKLPGDRKYRCKMATVKKRLGLESYNPDLTYHLVEKWHDSDGLSENGQWFGAVSVKGDKKYLVVLEGTAAAGAAINWSGVVRMTECDLLEAEFYDVFKFMPNESNDDQKKYVTEENEVLIVHKDGSLKLNEKTLPFQVTFPATGTMTYGDETSVLNWYHDICEETTTTAGIADVAGVKKEVDECEEVDECDESYNDNYNKSISSKEQRKNQADGSDPVRNEELLHVPTGKLGLVEHHDRQFTSIRCDDELIVDESNKFTSVKKLQPMAEVIKEFKSRNFTTERMSENKINVSKGMYRMGSISLIEDKMIYEMVGLEPKVFFYEPKKLVTIIDGIFGKK